MKIKEPLHKNLCQQNLTSHMQLQMCINLLKRF